MYEIEYTRDAFEDLSDFKKYGQQIIVSAIDEQLTWQPILETRNRKPLRPNEISRWELRIGKYRVFYDVDMAVNSVIIKAVGEKRPNQLFIRGRKFKL
ncbi:MAG: type II toxin-antitoxin system RelE/ParE family toxin [Chloroflexi bacterium]|jgi:mRNA-degrading endonuclease RelE of RelBE toxin-antitoxin system|nr:type II toxin-antitoxin system RelE/ParE family toxin [Chloroflexota bacterium]